MAFKIAFHSLLSIPDVLALKFLYIEASDFKHSTIFGLSSLKPMDNKLLSLVVCPVTKGPLVYDREHQELVSRSARLAYPIREGIPVLIEAEARVLSDAELER